MGVEKLGSRRIGGRGAAVRAFGTRLDEGPAAFALELGDARFVDFQKDRAVEYERDLSPSR